MGVVGVRGCSRFFQGCTLCGAPRTISSVLSYIAEAACPMAFRRASAMLEAMRIARPDHSPSSIPVDHLSRVSLQRP